MARARPSCRSAATRSCGPNSSTISVSASAAARRSWDAPTCSPHCGRRCRGTGARPGWSVRSSRCWSPTGRPRSPATARCGPPRPAELERVPAGGRGDVRRGTRPAAADRIGAPRVPAAGRRVDRRAAGVRAPRPIRRVAFKAEIGVMSRATSQIQGVWVRPDLRGRGLGTSAMATVIDYALRLTPDGQPVRQRLQPCRPDGCTNDWACGRSQPSPR